MAKPKSEAEFDLKKRLVGAFILIGFGVVVLPALLGGADPYSANDQLPVAAAPDSKIFVSKITPIGGETPSLTAVQPANPEQLVDAEPPQPDPITSIRPQSTEVSKAEPLPEPAQNTEAKPATVAKGEPGWVVRIGTFAKESNVERVVARLRQAGFEPSTTDVKSGQETVTRVWIGPYAQRVEAARMRVRVKQVTGSEGFIAAYP